MISNINPLKSLKCSEASKRGETVGHSELIYAEMTVHHVVRDYRSVAV